jgi:hypothetical protein
MGCGVLHDICIRVISYLVGPQCLYILTRMKLVIMYWLWFLHRLPWLSLERFSLEGLFESHPAIKVNVYLPSLMMKVPNHLYVLGDTYTCHT